MKTVIYYPEQDFDTATGKEIWLWGVKAQGADGVEIKDQSVDGYLDMNAALSYASKLADEANCNCEIGLPIYHY